MKKCVLVILVGIIVCGCGSGEDGREIEWRAKKGYEETEDKKQTLARAKYYMTESISGVVVAVAEDENADFSHVEYDIVAERDGYNLTRHYIGLYRSTGKLSGFPRSYFVLKVSEDGGVQRISLGE